MVYKTLWTDICLASSSLISLIVIILLKELTDFQFIMLFVFIICCSYGGYMIDKQILNQAMNKKQ